MNNTDRGRFYLMAINCYGENHELTENIDHAGKCKE